MMRWWLLALCVLTSVSADGHSSAPAKDRGPRSAGWKLFLDHAIHAFGKR